MDIYNQKKLYFDSSGRPVLSLRTREYDAVGQRGEIEDILRGVPFVTDEFNEDKCYLSIKERMDLTGNVAKMVMAYHTDAFKAKERYALTPEMCGKIEQSYRVKGEEIFKVTNFSIDFVRNIYDGKLIGYKTSRTAECHLELDEIPEMTVGMLTEKINENTPKGRDSDSNRKTLCAFAVMDSDRKMTPTEYHSYDTIKRELKKKYGMKVYALLYRGRALKMSAELTGGKKTITLYPMPNDGESGKYFLPEGNGKIIGQEEVTKMFPAMIKETEKEKSKWIELAIRQGNEMER